MLRFALGALLILGALLLLNRLGLWMERRGWIYWRKRRSRGTLGATLLELQKIFESGKPKHVIEAKRNDRKDPPDPGGGKP